METLKVLFGWGALASGLGYMVYTYIESIRVKKSLSWPTVAGVVTRAEVVRESTNTYNSRNTVYVAKIEYDYTVGEENFHGNTICLGGEFNTSFQSKAEERCEIYPVGSGVQVYYDPRDPAKCCLETTMEGAWFRYLIGAIFTIIGFAFTSGILGK